jgi:ribose 5-phosphate isomerase A
MRKTMLTTEDQYKQQAAEHALSLVQSGMRLGLGTGSTVNFMLHGLAARLRDGRLQDIAGVPTSETTAKLARQLGVPLISLADAPQLDLALDGADEIDPQLNLIKGLGAALLREKVVAASAARFVVFGSASKCVAILGVRTHVPVEVVAFAIPLCERRMAALGATPTLRLQPDGTPLHTDEGHVILDCRFPSIPDPSGLATAIAAIPGVMGHGLFVGMADTAIVAGVAGVQELAPVG